MAKTKKTKEQLYIRAEQFREIALAVLNDDDGICSAGYDAMYSLLDEDIRNAVEATSGRFYISQAMFDVLSKV